MATMTLDELVSQLQKAYGVDLQAVVLYGSAAAGEHIPKRSDYNVLVIVGSLPLERLRAVSAVTRAWREAGNPPPMTLTLQEWRSSADIFPMEYADILERNKVLHGALPSDGVSVRPADLRLQTEYQAMGKLLQLRQGVVSAGTDERSQLELLSASLSTLMVIFRAVERLHGERPPQDNETLSRRIAQRAQFDAEPFVRVVRHLRGEAKLTGATVADTLAGYLAGMQQLVAHLDRYSTNA